MDEFLRGWKRKIGCITLLMALVFMAGWMRSRDRYDGINLNGKLSFIGIASVCGRILLFRTNHVESLPFFNSMFLESRSVIGSNVGTNGIQTFDPTDGADIRWRRDWGGFHVSVCRESPFEPRPEENLMVPYWAIVFPLTAISAWLLLSQRRKSTQTKFI